MKPAKTRPYWHVDLKWISGILLFFALSSALLFFNLSKLTERDKSVEISATIVASLFSKEGLDDEQSLEELRQQAALLPGDTVAPLPQFPGVQISKEDLATKSAREIRIAIFKQLTEPIYDKGIRGAAASFTPDPAEQDEFVKDASLLGIFTKATHDMMQTAFVIATIVSIALLAALIFFSAGWGRLVSPAVLLLAVSPIGALLSLLLLFPSPEGDGPFSLLPRSVAQEIGGSLAQSYLVAAILGIVLFLAALIGKITQKILHRRASS